MAEVDFHNIPAVARRIARDELSKRISCLEIELAKERADFVALVNKLASSEKEMEGLRKGRAEELETMTSKLASLSADAEGLRLTISEQDSALRAGEATRAENEASLADAAEQIEEMKTHELASNARQQQLEATIQQLQLENENLQSLIAARNAARLDDERTQAKRLEELQTLTSRLASLSADAEGLRLTISEQDSALRAGEATRAENEASLADAAKQIEEMKTHELASNAHQQQLEATIEQLQLQNENLQSAIAARDAARLDDERTQAKRLEELQTLTSLVASISADAEGLRLALAERERAARVGEAARAENEARLVEVTKQIDGLRCEEAALKSKQEQLDAAVEELLLERAFARSSVAATELEQVDDEIATCRALADKCVFVVGFARSYTTITLEMLNCADNAFLLGEADFFLNSHGERFSDWYNKQHYEFQNQVTKSSHAPDFVPDRPHSWWQWLNSAAQFYDCIGDKIALSDYHLDITPPEAFQAFYEARFLQSRYVFLIRNPVEVLLSTAKLLSVVDDAGMARLCSAWLDFMQLWADFIRVFPRTMTIICERFGETTVSDLEAFTGLELPDAKLLINPANMRRHRLTKKFPTLVRLAPDFEKLYADAVVAADESRAFWQAEQKRIADANDTTGNDLGAVAVAPRALGRVWVRIQELRDVVAQPSGVVGL